MFSIAGSDQIAPSTHGTDMKLVFSDKQSQSLDASDIFVVNETDGTDEGVKKLISLMQRHGQSFYSENNSSGIIGKNDVIIIKVNSQWDERGGTNTDLVKALIQAIVDHPQGFEGEVVIADNGQARGSLSYVRNNAEDISQSMQEVANSFPGYKVSTYLWDIIATKRVNEYAEGDLQDGYVVDGSIDPKTGLVVTYPKFKTKYGTNISFKLGVWVSHDHRRASGRSGRRVVSCSPTPRWILRACVPRDLVPLGDAR